MRSKDALTAARLSSGVANVRRTAIPRAYSITASVIFSWAAVISRVTDVERRRNHSRTTSPTAMPAKVTKATGGAKTKKNRLMITAMATPPERPVKQMVMNSSSWWTVVVSVVVMAERRCSEKYPMGAPFRRSPTRRRRSRNTWKPSASIIMSTRYWNANCPAA